MARALDPEEVRAFYDRFGAKQDWQSFYEDPALDVMIEYAALGTAQAVLEFGCGTGRLAERMLSRELSASARYVGVDLSATMVDLATRRVSGFGQRARVLRSQAGVRLAFPDESFDRFVSTYVLDLLGEPQIRDLLSEAHRVLKTGGRLCVVSLTRGGSVASRFVSGAWSAIHSVWPRLVGGCRPVAVEAFLEARRWAILHRRIVTAWAVPSEVLVAEAA